MFIEEKSYIIFLFLHLLYLYSSLVQIFYVNFKAKIYLF